MTPPTAVIVHSSKGVTVDANADSDSFVMRKRDSPEGDDDDNNNSPKKAKALPLGETPPKPAQPESHHHSGDLVLDEESSVWDDWDHGPRDTPENQRDFPDGFYWTCCGAIGTVEGCPQSEAQQHTSSEGSEHCTDSERYCEGHPGWLEVVVDPARLETNNDDRPLDTPTNRREHPEWFAWSCCGRPAGSAGCQAIHVDQGSDTDTDESEDGTVDGFGSNAQFLN